MFRRDQGTTAKERFSGHQQFALEVGGINGPRIKTELSHRGIYVSPWAEDLLDRLPKAGEQEHIETVKFSLREVGVRDYISGVRGWNSLVSNLKREGLNLLPQLTGPEMALLNPDIIGNGEYVRVLSEPTTDRDGYRDVFGLGRRGGGLGLYGDLTDYGLYPDDLAVARLG